MTSPWSSEARTQSPWAHWSQNDRQQAASTGGATAHGAAPSPARRFWWQTPGLALVVVGLVACGKGDPPPAATAGAGANGGRERVLVKVATVSQEPMAAVYSTSATLRAAQRATVTARTRGVIEALAVEEGNRVRAGQQLAVLENDEQTIAHQRNVTRRDQLRRDYTRSAELAKQGLLSEGALETATRDLADAEQTAALTELELSRTVIRAPFGGLVLTRFLDVGATVSDGTPVYELAATDTLYADVNVPERHVARLAPRQQVRIVADATNDQVAAEIERIAPAVDPATGTVKVTLAVPGRVAEGRLRPGTFVRVDIVTDQRTDALVVPRSALVAEGRRWFLYRAVDELPSNAPAPAPITAAAAAAGDAAPPPEIPPTSGPFAEKVEVALGFEEGGRVEVRPASVDPDDPNSAGRSAPATAVVAGDRIVVAGAGALSNGSPLTIEAEPVNPAGSATSTDDLAASPAAAP